MAAPHVIIANTFSAQYVHKGKVKVWSHLVNALEIYDYFLHHGASVDIANATYHTAHYW